MTIKDLLPLLPPWQEIKLYEDTRPQELDCYADGRFVDLYRGTRDNLSELLTDCKIVSMSATGSHLDIQIEPL